MVVSARPVTSADTNTIVAMYRALEAEQAALRPIWPETEGLEGSLAGAVSDLVASERHLVVIGTIDSCPMGFLTAELDALNERGDGRGLGVVRYIYTEEEARGVGVGQAMFDLVIGEMRDRGIGVFDAVVSPGHRLAKNFFESQGFSARLIVMNHVD